MDHTYDRRSLRRHGSDELQIRRNLTRTSSEDISPASKERGAFCWNKMRAHPCPFSTMALHADRGIGARIMPKKPEEQFARKHPWPLRQGSKRNCRG